MDELLQFFIISVYSALKDGGYSEGDFEEILFNNCVFMS